MYKQQRFYENQEKMIFQGTGEFGIPAIMRTEYSPCEFIPFNYAKTCKDKNGKGIHFFLDDYQFTRLWTNPNTYIDLLSQFDFVCTPDFSTYTEWPKALQIYNHFRKHWIGAYMQVHGINVVPTISWSDKESYDWCFDGEPKYGVVAVSSVGCMNNEEKKQMFMDGYEEMIKRLEPETILFYGNVPESCSGNIVNIKSYIQKRFGKD